MSSRRRSNTKKQKVTSTPQPSLGKKILDGALKTMPIWGPLLGLPFKTSGFNAVASPMGGEGLSNISAPVANGSVVTPSNVGRRSHRTGRRMELIASIEPSTEFTVAYSQPINPGNPMMFPWLSTEARLYEEFRFTYLEFLYEPATATTQTGNIFMAFDYNAMDNLPLTDTQIMAYEGASMSAPWFPSCSVASIKSLNVMTKNYITSGNVAPAQQDPKTYFPGKFLLATQDNDITQLGGRLFVIYDVEFSAPQLDNPIGLQTDITGLNNALSIPILPLGEEPNIRGNMAVRVLNQVQGDGAGTNASFDLQFSCSGTFLLIMYANTGVADGTNFGLTWGGSSNSLLSLLGIQAAGANTTGASMLTLLLTIADTSELLSFLADDDNVVGVSLIFVSYDTTIDPNPGLIDQSLADPVLELCDVLSKKADLKTKTMLSSFVEKHAVKPKKSPFRFPNHRHLRKQKTFTSPSPTK